MSSQIVISYLEVANCDIQFLKSQIVTLNLEAAKKVQKAGRLSSQTGGSQRSLI